MNQHQQTLKNPLRRNQTWKVTTLVPKTLPNQRTQHSLTLDVMYTRAGNPVPPVHERESTTAQGSPGYPIPGPSLGITSAS